MARPMRVRGRLLAAGVSVGAAAGLGGAMAATDHTVASPKTAAPVNSVSGGDFPTTTVPAAEPGSGGRPFQYGDAFRHLNPLQVPKQPPPPPNFHPGSHTHTGAS